jgi:MoxR-like ATPase
LQFSPPAVHQRHAAERRAGRHHLQRAHQEFEFKPGPVFTNFLLADEINRATPKTQSALLEAMNEVQVTIEGRSYALEQPFMVMATQNPVEHHGTYPLPESSSTAS